ncbi:hypothetical protein [Elizabethkingia bruuniana]|uniref:hypothetical protein n=1 Tax=Elizabethkingia bruuniana TaxID=1756149 RepID=UPI00398C293A
MPKIHDDDFDRLHFNRVEANVRKVNNLYNRLIGDIVKAVSSGRIDPNRLFQFSDYPDLNKKSTQLFESFAKNIFAEIQHQMTDSWKFAEKKQSTLVNKVARKLRLSKEQVSKYNAPNLEALNAFQNRKSDGLRLSDRVWNYSNQYKKEIELGLDLGIGDGKSGAALARELKQYLREPDRLFRRVRDKHGQLVLSKAAQAYHPGQGVYRSSVKNAQRLTRTENNNAYHESNFLKYQQFDFVIGIRIKLSNNPNHCDFCETMAGEYPKDFKFWGWHPQCRCTTVPILKTWEQMEKDNERIIQGKRPLKSKDAIAEPPLEFRQWISNNQEKISAAKVKPYFIQNNPKLIGDIAQKQAFVFDTKEIKNLGFAVSNRMDLDDLPGIYDKYMKGFDLKELDSEMLSIIENNGIRLDGRYIEFQKDNIEVTYYGDKIQMMRVFSIQDSKNVVEHAYLKIDPSLQGKDMTKEMFRAWYKQYANSDLDEIHVHANIDVGGYAWSRYGFGAKAQKDIIDVIRKASSTLSGDDLKIFSKWIIESEKNAFFDMNKLSFEPFAKKLLLGTDWYGFLNLKDRKQSKIFTDYLFGK